MAQLFFVSVSGPDGKALCWPASREILCFDLQYWLAQGPAKFLTAQPLYLPPSRLISCAFEFSILLCPSLFTLLKGSLSLQRVSSLMQHCSPICSRNMPEDDRYVMHKQTKCLTCYSKSFDINHVYNVGEVGFGCNSCPTKRNPGCLFTQ